MPMCTPCWGTFQNTHAPQAGVGAQEGPGNSEPPLSPPRFCAFAHSARQSPGESRAHRHPPRREALAGRRPGRGLAPAHTHAEAGRTAGSPGCPPSVSSHRSLSQGPGPASIASLVPAEHKAAFARGRLQLGGASPAVTGPILPLHTAGGPARAHGLLSASPLASGERKQMLGEETRGRRSPQTTAANVVT